MRAFVQCGMKTFQPDGGMVKVLFPASRLLHAQFVVTSRDSDVRGVENLLQPFRFPRLSSVRHPDRTAEQGSKQS